jgi:uncharacterized protein YukE
MGKAHADPAELRRFAQDLNRFNNELGSLMTSLQARLRALESVWQDQEQRKFQEAFEATYKGLIVFMQNSDVQVKSLTKKAALLEEYLKGH